MIVQPWQKQEPKNGGAKRKKKLLQATSWWGYTETASKKSKLYCLSSSEPTIHGHLTPIGNGCGLSNGLCRSLRYENPALPDFICRLQTDDMCDMDVTPTDTVVIEPQEDDNNNSRDSDNKNEDYEDKKSDSESDVESGISDNEYDDVDYSSDDDEDYSDIEWLNEYRNWCILLLDC